MTKDLWQHHPLAPGNITPWHLEKILKTPWHLEIPHQRLRKRCLDESWALLNEVGDPKGDETGHFCLGTFLGSNILGQKVCLKKKHHIQDGKLCHLILFLAFVERTVDIWNYQHSDSPHFRAPNQNTFSGKTPSIFSMAKVGSRRLHPGRELSGKTLLPMGVGVPWASWGTVMLLHGDVPRLGRVVVMLGIGLRRELCFFHWTGNDPFWIFMLGAVSEKKRREVTGHGTSNSKKRWVFKQLLASTKWNERISS